MALFCLLLYLNYCKKNYIIKVAFKWGLLTMQIGSFTDNKISKNITYNYYHRNTDILYLPDYIKEHEKHDFYNNKNGNLFFGKAVGWKDSVILQNGVDIKFCLEGRCFVDHVDLVQGEGSAVNDIEILTVVDGEYKKIGFYKPATGKLIEDDNITISVGYYCDNIIVRLNGNCMPVVVKKLDVWGAWDLENTVYPTPQKAEFKNNTFSLADIKTIKASGEDETFVAEYLKEKVEEKTGYVLEISESNGDITFEVEKTGDKDSFVLETDNGKCMIKAANRLSMFYAADAFVQLIYGDKVKCCRIEDEAFMEFRGAHFPLPPRNQIGFLKNMVKYVFVPMRYNIIFIEVAGAMRYDNYPEINEKWIESHEKYAKGEWPKPAHYGMLGENVLEKSEVRDLVEYMSSFGLEVVPEVQSWGHTQYITTAYPYLAEKVAQKDDNDNIDLNKEDIMPSSFYPHTMCPNHKDYYDVTFGVLDEVLDVFKPKRFVHMGHDEIYGVGQCSVCSQIPRGDIFAKEVTTLNDYIKSKGLNMMIWSDMLQNMEYSTPTAINKVPKDVIMLDFVWYFHLDDDIEDNLISHGFKVIMGNMYSSHYPRYEARSHKEGIYGAEVSTWVPCNELSYAYYGKMFDFVFSAEGMWNSSYDSSFRNTYNELIKPVLTDIRLIIGNLKCDKPEKKIDIKGARNNIPFDIKDIIPYNGVVQVTSFDTTVDVEVGYYAEIITFVHATDTSSHKIMWDDPTKIGEYVICYEDGSVVTEDIMYAGNIYKYLSPYGDIIGSVFYRHQGYAGTYLTIPECGKTYNGEDYTLGKYSMKNPFPEKKITSIKINHLKNTGAKIMLFDLLLK